MTTAKYIEYRITRNLLRLQTQRREPRFPGLADRLITTVAVVAAMLLLGAWLQELLWALLAAGAVLTLGTRSA